MLAQELQFGHAFCICTTPPMPRRRFPSYRESFMNSRIDFSTGRAERVLVGGRSLGVVGAPADTRKTTDNCGDLCGYL